METIDLKEFRKANNLLQKDIASFFGTNVSFVTNIENNRAKLPYDKMQMLIDNDRGWKMPEQKTKDNLDSENKGSLLEVVKSQQGTIERLSRIIEKLSGCDNYEKKEKASL